MRKKISMLALFFSVIVLLAACGGEKYVPQAINEETDVCVICKMAIKDDQFATQIITKDGQSLKFDDIGCLNTWKTENGTDTIGAEFVRDYHSKQWIRYEKAYYAYDSSYQTPMAYGILSFEEKADAQAYIDEQGKGKLMTANELANHSWEVNHDMMGDHGHSHSDDGHGEGESGHTHDKEEGHSNDNKHQTTEGHGA